jgi:hypothetical protein
MDILNGRFDRSHRFFGKEGQGRLATTSLLIVGGGGVGTHCAQQAALLGVGQIGVLDPEELDPTNKNRYVGVWHDDPAPGSLKVALAARHIALINPRIDVYTSSASLLSEDGLRMVREANYVLGGVDNDGVRFVLNEMCLAYSTPLFDLASDVLGDGVYGGRVFYVSGEGGCLVCNSLLDMREVRRFLSPGEANKAEDAVYGVDRDLLGTAGPSVGPINGVVSNLALVEFMAEVTGLRRAVRHVDYRADRATARVREVIADKGCYYCNSVRGSGDGADIRRYFGQAVS